MKKVAVLYSDYTPVIDAIKYQLADCEVNCFTTAEHLKGYDMVIITNFSGEFNGNGLKCHYSLLPAYDCKEPAKRAIVDGAKVTGVTIYYTETKKIVAQYPVFIRNDIHYDELEWELKYIEQILLPIVAQKILRNEPFEAQELFNKKCGNCGGCSSCSH